MTGDFNHDEDELNFDDDDEFILEDEDFDDELDGEEETMADASPAHVVGTEYAAEGTPSEECDDALAFEDELDDEFADPASASGEESVAEEMPPAESPSDATASDGTASDGTASDGTASGDPTTDNQTADTSASAPVDWSKTNADSPLDPNAQDDSDDLLFEPNTAEFGASTSGHEHFSPNLGKGFAEEGSWSGRELSPDEMGMPGTEGHHDQHYELDAGLVADDVDTDDLQLIGEDDDFGTELVDVEDDDWHSHAEEAAREVETDETGNTGSEFFESVTADEQSVETADALADANFDDDEFVITSSESEWDENPDVGAADEGTSADFAAASAANFEIEPGADELPEDAVDLVAGSSTDVGSGVTYESTVPDPEADAESVGAEIGVGQAYGELSFGSTDGDAIEERAEGDEEWDAEGDFGNEEIDDDDPIYGSEAEAGAEAAVAEEEAYKEPNFKSYEETYVDEEEEPVPQLIGGAQGGRRIPWGGFASAAAAVLVVAAGAVVFVKPEWFGIQETAVEVARVEIKRPTVDLALATPELDKDVLAQAAAKALAPDIEVITGKTPDVVAKTEVDPVEPTETITEPVTPEEGPATDLVVAGETGDDPNGSGIELVEPATPGEPDELAAQEVTEELDILTVRCGDLVISNEPVLADADLIRSLKLGTRAFAQLKNDSFFIGVVTRVSTSKITLRVDTGNVTFAIADLRSLAPMATAAAAEAEVGVLETTAGYVRLRNKSRLFGSILTSSSSDKIILRTRNSRVSLPSSSVDQRGVSLQGGVSISDDEDGSWLKDRIEEERMRVGLPVDEPAATPGKR